jgi:RPA family protein
MSVACVDIRLVFSGRVDPEAKVPVSMVAEHLFAGVGGKFAEQRYEPADRTERVPAVGERLEVG